MAGLLDSIDQRTRLAGHNRLELLLFRLGGKQVFGINVFKVQEVIQCPPLTKLPNAHPVIRGVANMRGKTISVMDLAMAIGKPPTNETGNCYVIVTEYNRQIQGFLVGSVDRIVNMNWEEILPAPKGSGRDNYLTAVTRVDAQLVEIIDVEKVLAEVVGQRIDLSKEVKEGVNGNQAGATGILIADDSSVARNQVKRTLDQVGLPCTVTKNGREALEMLKMWADEGTLQEHVSMVISDVEMPEMDGYTLTTEIRQDPRLKDLYIMLHTSLSGVFNNAMIEKVGANKFISKFNPDELATGVMEALGEAQQH